MQSIPSVLAIGPRLVAFKNIFRKLRSDMTVLGNNAKYYFELIQKQPPEAFYEKRWS